MINTKVNQPNRDEIIIKYLPLVKYIAGRIFINKNIPIDMNDLINSGVLGLIDAVDRFDKEKGVKFETYASLRIRGSIIDELRRVNFIPRTAAKKIMRLNDCRDELKIKLGREVEDSELANALGIKLDELNKIENYINFMSTVSLDDVLFNEEDEINFYGVIEDEKSPKPDDLFEKKEKHELLKKAIDMLEEKDKIILNLYYNEKLTLKEIGKVLGISESRVCQVHSRVILRLRNNLKKLDY